MLMSNERRRRKKKRRVGRLRFFRLFLLLVLLASVAVLSAAVGVYTALAGNLPSLEAQAPYEAAQTTKIYAGVDQPVLLAELHGVENREIVSGDQIAQTMRDAVVAVEDERFWEHKGVDFVGIFRALVADLREGEIVQGGSTITQQLIKNAYISNEQTLDRKFKEAVLAYQLEKRWSKEKILNEYLNIIYFGQGAYGVEAAAQEYFGAHAKDLKPAQAALLAAIPKSPAKFDPRTNPESALGRRNMILNKMFQQGYLTGVELQEALATPLEFAPSKREAGTKAPYWVEMVREQLVAKYGSNTVLKGGLRVYTSVNLELQSAAEEIIRETFNRPGDPAASLVSIDLETGEVLAMVGGLDFQKQKFNLATQGRRQPGSAFKPFVLAAALEQGKGPASVYPSGPVTVSLPGDDWQVKSPDLGAITFSEAVSRSSNGVFARLIMDVGADQVVNMAHQLGIESELEPRPAIALGGLEHGVTPMEMAVAYGTFGSGGMRLSGSVTFEPERGRQPITITRVEDSQGNLLDENRLVRSPALDPRFAYAITDMLKGVIERGTGRAADIGRPAAGKTGTTQQYRDAWFVGYTPQMVTAVWVGYPDSQKEMTDVHGRRVTGGSFPAEIWAAFMKRALADVEPSDFSKPEGVDWVEATVCTETGLLATSWCPETIASSFLEGLAPTRSCDLHGPSEVELPNLVGLSLEEAEALLDELRLEVATTEEDDPDTPAGVVLAQDPSGGTLIMQGNTVTLTISSGTTAGAPVPDVIGRSQEEAVAVLEDAGFSVQVSRESADAPPGVVTGQAPAPGFRADPGTVVTLVVSRGNEDDAPPGGQDHVVVPDVVGTKVREAIILLENAGLQAEIETVPFEKPSQAGTVADQSENPGTEVPKGSSLLLRVYAAR
ncbi:MAG: hypothetical protein Kow00129_07660 [Thermoleophilia bacterium]